MPRGKSTKKTEDQSVSKISKRGVLFNQTLDHETFGQVVTYQRRGGFSTIQEVIRVATKQLVKDMPINIISSSKQI